MKVALVGLGGAAQRGHLPALRQLALHRMAELVAVCDLDPARLAAASGLARAVRTFRDLESLLDATRPDLLVIATDPAAHIEFIRLGLAHGCDVLCEKPVALNPADYEQLRELRDLRPRRALVPVHQYRYAPGWRRFVSWARAMSDDPFDLAVRVERPGADPHAISSWRNNPGSGGGLADHGVHFLALARDLGSSMTALSADRSYDDHNREHVRGQVTVGSGVLDLTVNYSADHRRTTVSFRSNRHWMHWTDDEVLWSNTGRLVHRRRLPALSDRRHVDGLYLPLYADVLTRRTAPGWRDGRWREVVEVGDVLIELGRLANEAIELAPRPTK